MQPQSVPVETLFQLICQLTVEKALLLQQIQILANETDKKVDNAAQGSPLSNGHDEVRQESATRFLEGYGQSPRG